MYDIMTVITFECYPVLEYIYLRVCVWGGAMLVNATFNDISVTSFDYFYTLQILFFLNNHLPAFDDHTFKTSNNISPNISILS